MSPSRITRIAAIISIAAIIPIAGCRQPAQEQLFDVAANSIFNAAMSTNPLASAYAPEETGDESSRVRTCDSSFSTGCPSIAIDGIFFPPLFNEQQITVTFEDNCTIDGMAIEGIITGAWKFFFDGFDPMVRMELGFTDFLLDTMVTNGDITALPSVNYKGPNVLLTGRVSTTLASGDNRTLTYDDLSAQIDFNEELWPFNPAENDDATFLNPLDDLLIVDGAAEYIDEMDQNFSVTYDNMTQHLVCFFPDNGTMTVVNDELELSALVDFSAEDDNDETFCDSIVAITIGDETRTYDLAEWAHGERRPWEEE